jgi:hypothetical protein
MADRDFDQFAGPGGKHIDPQVVRSDVEDLISAGKRVEELADRRIAHHDKKEVSAPPTYNDVDACINLLDRLYCRYNLALHAAAQATLNPTYQYDWKEIFRHKWIEDEEI